MSDDPSNHPPTGEPAGPIGSRLPADNASAASQPHGQNGGPVAMPPPAASVRRKGARIWPGMTPEERAAYVEGNKTRRSRKKVHPSLDKHRELLEDCVKHGAVMAQVFDDLIEDDPEVLDDFGPDGHRTFNGHVKRQFE